MKFLGLLDLRPSVPRGLFIISHLSYKVFIVVIASPTSLLLYPNTQNTQKTEDFANKL
jgi:hypothetical protein